MAKVLACAWQFEVKKVWALQAVHLMMLAQPAEALCRMDAGDQVRWRFVFGTVLAPNRFYAWLRLVF